MTKRKFSFKEEMILRAIHTSVMQSNVPIVYSFNLSNPYYWRNNKCDKLFLVPGSFNPIHEAHRELHKLAMEKLLKEVEASSNSKKIYLMYEMALDNRSKGPMSFGDFLERMANFTKYESVLITSSPYFFDKIEDLEVEVEFFIGSDVALKILEDHSIEDIEDSGDREVIFTIFDRILDGKLVTISEEKVLPNNFKLAGILDGKLAEISSTILRRQNK
jgi:nicotinic acid mononucleotide adenylyltransferase